MFDFFVKVLKFLFILLLLVTLCASVGYFFAGEVRFTFILFITGTFLVFALLSDKLTLYILKAKEVKGEKSIVFSESLRSAFYHHKHNKPSVYTQSQHSNLCLVFSSFLSNTVLIDESFLYNLTSNEASMLADEVLSEVNSGLKLYTFGFLLQLFLVESVYKLFRVFGPFQNYIYMSYIVLAFPVIELLNFLSKTKRNSKHRFLLQKFVPRDEAGDDISIFKELLNILAGKSSNLFTFRARSILSSKKELR